MNRQPDAAVAKFLSGYNCAQSVFFAFCGSLGFDEDTALKLASGFGAGMGRKEEVCGAVVGGVMAIGARFGRGRRDEKSATETCYQKTRQLLERFAARQGSYICRDLLQGCELLSDQGQAEFKEKDLLHQVCQHCVRTAAEITAELIAPGRDQPAQGKRNDPGGQDGKT